MIVILITVIFILSLTIAYLGIDFYRKKKVFRKRIEALEAIIVQISRKTLLQSNQLRLSDDLTENLKNTKTVLSGNIFHLNYELFEILSKNNLLKNNPEQS